MLWGRPFHFWSFGLAWVSLAERMRATRFVSGRAARRLRVGVQSPFTLITRWGFAIPERLLIAPQDIRTSDPTIADDIYAGHFSLASRIVNTHGQSPFVIVPPSQEWTEALHGFGWLRHLRAADTVRVIPGERVVTMSRDLDLLDTLAVKLTLQEPFGILSLLGILFNPIPHGSGVGVVFRL